MIAKEHNYDYYGLKWKVFYNYHPSKDTIELTAYATNFGDPITRLRMDFEVAEQGAEHYLVRVNDDKWPECYLPLAELTDAQKFMLYSQLLDDLVWNVMQNGRKFDSGDRKFLIRAIETYPNSPEEN